MKERTDIMNKIFAALLAVCIISETTALAASPSPNPTASPSPTVSAEVSPSPEASPDAAANPSESEAPLESETPSESALPQSSAAPTLTPSPDMSTSVDFDIRLIPRDYITGDTIKLELCNMDGEPLASFEQWIDENTPTFQAHFEVPEYKMGTQFKLKTIDGINCMKYYDSYAGKGNSLVFTTNGYYDENKNYVQENLFSVECDPRHEKGVYIYLPGGLTQLNQRARIIDGVTMVPVRQVAEGLGLKVTYSPEYNTVTCAAGNDKVIFNVNTPVASVLGTDVTAPYATCNIDGTVFVPVRTLADAVNSSIDVHDYGEYLDITLGNSEIVTNYRNSNPVMAKWSDTPYLVWVSKHEFKVRVYMGEQYNWELLKEFPCAIGAPGSETITGTFKYQYRMGSWNYDGYYVGPALVFYGGYALHSTLLYYGGGEYDGTVGKKISHGCVRLHPQDINWIDAYVPVKSTIYITE